MENYSKADTVKNATLRFLVVSQRPLPDSGVFTSNACSAEVSRQSASLLDRPSAPRRMRPPARPPDIRARPFRAAPDGCPRRVAAPAVPLDEARDSSRTAINAGVCWAPAKTGSSATGRKTCWCQVRVVGSRRPSRSRYAASSVKPSLIPAQKTEDDDLFGNITDGEAVGLSIFFSRRDSGFVQQVII